MRYSKLSLARHEQVERPRPFAPRLRLLRSSESSDDSQHTHHHRASPGRVLGFSSPPVSALWCWHSTSSVRHRSGSPARKPASAAFPPVAWRGAFSRSSNTDRSAQSHCRFSPSSTRWSRSGGTSDTSARALHAPDSVGTPARVGGIPAGRLAILPVSLVKILDYRSFCPKPLSFSPSPTRWSRSVGTSDTSARALQAPDSVGTPARVGDIPFPPVAWRFCQCGAIDRSAGATSVTATGPGASPSSTRCFRSVGTSDTSARPASTRQRGPARQLHLTAWQKPNILGFPAFLY
jgi:hypothetical protein